MFLSIVLIYFLLNESGFFQGNENDNLIKEDLFSCYYDIEVLKPDYQTNFVSRYIHFISRFITF